MSVSLKFTNGSVKKIQLYILASIFQILLLRINDLLVVQYLISQFLPNQKIEESFVFSLNWLMP